MGLKPSREKRAQIKIKEEGEGRGEAGSAEKPVLKKKGRKKKEKCNGDRERED